MRVLAAAPDGNVRDGAQAVAIARALVEQSRSWRTLEALAMALAESVSSARLWRINRKPSKPIASERDD